MSASVAWISIAPVKGMRLQNLSEAVLGPDGIPGDRSFFLIDERRAMISSVRIGALLGVVPAHDPIANSLTLHFPDGSEVVSPVELGEPEPVSFYGESVTAKPVIGPFSTALSDLAGQELRLMARPRNRPAVDRGSVGGTTLLSTASLERLRIEGGVDEPIDPRRFRMTFGLDGLEAHEEDRWLGQEVGIGDAAVRVEGLVGRCVLTTRDPDIGKVDLKVLHFLDSYRGDVVSEEPLPFGVFARVVRSGRVRVGDPVSIPST